MRRPTHFSYSSLTLHEECARRYYYKYLERLPEPKGLALERGIRVHAQLEAAMWLDTGLDEDTWLGNLVQRYRKAGGVPEVTVAVDRDWCELPDIGSWHPDTYTMAKVDVLILPRKKKIGTFVDWKTGRIYADKHEDQGDLYATVLATTTKTERWHADLVYVDHEHVEPLAYEVDRKRSQRRWDRRAKKMFDDNDFEANPGSACRWCPYHKRKGGPCPDGV